MYGFVFHTREAHKIYQEYKYVPGIYICRNVSYNQGEMAKGTMNQEIVAVTSALMLRILNIMPQKDTDRDRVVRHSGNARGPDRPLALHTDDDPVCQQCGLLSALTAIETCHGQSPVYRK